MEREPSSPALADRTMWPQYRQARRTQLRRRGRRHGSWRSWAQGNQKTTPQALRNDPDGAAGTL
jgi:hypothetical protein